MDDKPLPRDVKLITRSRDLRNNATKQENHLWYDYLRKQPVHFYRQRIIGEYIVDFYCPAIKLVIEIDGSQHYESEGIEYDEHRTAYLEGLGLSVKRFMNNDIDRNFLGVCTVIEEILSQLR
jgi:very-short-patch-repair endonuclease